MNDPLLGGSRPDGDEAVVIAEAGVNHNGSLDRAKRLVDVAAEAGADAVKFQTFQADALAAGTVEKAAYQKETTDAESSQQEMLRDLELPPSFHDTLVQHCADRGIPFLSSPFDRPSLDLLVRRFDLPCIKIPSGEITNAPLLLEIARSGRPAILSTGMSTIDEVEAALGVLAFGYLQPNADPSADGFRAAYASPDGQRELRDKVVVLHCTSEYPAPVDEVNLRAMDTLRSTFDLAVGLSDHTRGTSIPIAAVARGASVVEKHFTLDRTLPGPDHEASLEPGELSDMIEGIRRAEKALGSRCKRPTHSETKNRPVVRKSLVAAESISEGEPFTTENLTTKRPGRGLSPMRYWEMLSRRASRDYATDDLIAE